MSTSAKGGKGLRIGLWIAQGLLILGFGVSGAGKIPIDYAEFAKKAAWVSHTPPWLVRVIGVAEVLGALGLLLPSVTRIAPKLSGIAALGLLLIMILAAGMHIAIIHESAFEAPFIGINVVLGAMAAFVAWGRLSGAPIPAR